MSNTNKSDNEIRRLFNIHEYMRIFPIKHMLQSYTKDTQKVCRAQTKYKLAPETILSAHMGN